MTNERIQQLYEEFIAAETPQAVMAVWEILIKEAHSTAVVISFFKLAGVREKLTDSLVVLRSITGSK